MNFPLKNENRKRNENWNWKMENIFYQWTLPERSEVKKNKKKFSGQSDNSKNWRDKNKKEENKGLWTGEPTENCEKIGNGSRRLQEDKLWALKTVLVDQVILFTNYWSPYCLLASHATIDLIVKLINNNNKINNSSNVCTSTPSLQSLIILFTIPKTQTRQQLSHNDELRKGSVVSGLQEQEALVSPAFREGFLYLHLFVGWCCSSW